MIGVLEDTAFFAPGVTTSRATVDDLAGSPLAAQSYQFRLADGVDPVAVAKDLEKAFAQNGLQAVAIEKEIEEGSATQALQQPAHGFHGSWPPGRHRGPRRHRGPLRGREKAADRDARALGFQRGQVRLAFLIESSFVALLGIGLGVARRGALRRDRRLFRGADLRYPLHGAMEHLGVIVGLAYFASLLTTFLPASQASRVYPAEALRYE